nr:beta-glucanase/beta-glucan synthetase [Lysinibacillus fusiformis]
MSISGCSNYKTKDKEATAESNVNQNPFEVDGKETDIMGSMEHAFVNPEVNEHDEMLPLRYDGGELKIEYSVKASGNAKNVGFLVFVDGIPQPYKFNTSQASYEYMHILNLEEDDKNMPFTFVFTPVTGKKGDSLDLSITSVYNPSFIPDMKETSSYGGYHTTLESSRSLVFKKNAEAFDHTTISRNGYIRNINITSEPVTQQMLDTYSDMEKLNLEALDKRVFSQLYFDGKVKHDNIKINDKGTVHVSFKIFGHPGVKYQNTFFMNHEVLANDDGTSFETTLTKGDVAVIDLDINLEKLDDFSTFYVVSVPLNATDFPEDVVVLEKTPSILLYK